MSVATTPTNVEQPQRQPMAPGLQGMGLETVGPSSTGRNYKESYQQVGDRVLQVAHRPSLEQLFGKPPEDAPVTHGIPHPAEVESSFWDEIERQREPRLPLGPRPGIIRIMAIGNGAPRTVELTCNEEVLAAEQIKRIVRARHPEMFQDQRWSLIRITGETLEPTDPNHRRDA